MLMLCPFSTTHTGQLPSQHNLQVCHLCTTAWDTLYYVL